MRQTVPVPAGRNSGWHAFAIAIVAGMAGATTAAIPARAAECLLASPQGPMTVTSDCEDPLYNARTFVIDKVSEVPSPLPHKRVDAHFTPAAGAPIYKVTFYLPPAESWQGRFFQHAYPLEQPENLDDVTFALRNGAFLVNVAGVPCGCGGYRPDAAAAKIARNYASRLYKTDRRIYGYVWGGSGGGLLTSGAAEHTQGVWDGIVPYVMPNAASLANVNAIGSLAGLALHDRLTDIADAVAPGSARDPFDDLTQEQQSILREALDLGTPLETFENSGPFGRGSNPLLMVLSAGVKTNDPTYVEDFWSKPGYAGANPPAFLKKAIREEWATVTEVQRDANGKLSAVRLDRAPVVGDTPFAGLSFEYWLYDADGTAKLGEIGGRLDKDTIQLGTGGAGRTGQLGQGIEALLNRATLGEGGRVTQGQRIKVNNLNFLALHYYHRHAMPRERDMYVYDRLRSPDGSPLYPQRGYLAAAESAASTAGGGTQTGQITTKVMVVQSMVDAGAQPWMADWYARRVLKALGDRRYADSFRIYFNDNAGHLDSPPRGREAASTINYVPALHQSVLDLAAWVERGVQPPPSTRYSVKDGQVILAPTAPRRRGIQPVVELKAAGADRVEVAPGQTVSFVGTIEAPPGAGDVTEFGWWFGEQPFVRAIEPATRPARRVIVRRDHQFMKPGTYFVTLWGGARRTGNSRPGHEVAENLDRVRVIVR